MRYRLTCILFGFGILAVASNCTSEIFIPLRSAFPTERQGLNVVTGVVLDYELSFQIDGEPTHYSLVSIKPERWILRESSTDSSATFKVVSRGTLWTNEDGKLQTNVSRPAPSTTFLKPGDHILAICAARGPRWTPTGASPDHRVLGFVRHLPEGSLALDQRVQLRTSAEILPAINQMPETNELLFDPTAITQTFENDGRTLAELIDEIVKFYESQP